MAWVRREMRLGLTAPDRPQWRPIALTKDEYSLLIAFLDAPQRPLSREYLLQATRVHEEILDRAVDVQIWLGGNRRSHRLHRPESLVALGSARQRRLAHTACRLTTTQTAGIFAISRFLLPKSRCAAR
jgi:DNA-binding response OmpR family regulator